jgi:N-acetylglucosaminyl-diphospho-decaprenol L-rhamnosyltransferase
LRRPLADPVKIRIVVVNYNGAGFAALAIESALGQSLPCSVILVDNGSSDGSADSIAAHYPSVRIVQTGSNLGFGAAATIGALVQPADYNYVAFLNSDAVAQTQWIERLCRWMREEAVDIGSSVVSGKEQPFFAGGAWLPFLGSAVRRRRYAGTDSAWISGCAMVARREVFEALGGFDRSYFLYYEDVDLSLRAASQGFRLGIYREALVAHAEEGRSANRLGSLQKRCIGLRSKGKLVRRFVPYFALPSALTFQCLVSPAVNGATLREYPALIRAFIDGFQESD